MMSAAESDMAAVNHRAFTLPAAPMRKAARAGPTMTTRESRDWVRPMNFCRLRPSRSQTVGTRESRAVMPGMSPMAPRRPRATNQPKERPHTMSTTGSRATLAADRMSETMETLRRLKRSVSAPPIRPMTNWGTAQMSARVPAARAAPVAAALREGQDDAGHGVAEKRTGAGKQVAGGGLARPVRFAGPTEFRGREGHGGAFLEQGIADSRGQLKL